MFPLCLAIFRLQSHRLKKPESTNIMQARGLPCLYGKRPVLTNQEKLRGCKTIAAP